MKTALLDVNVLTALVWPAHEHHEVAHRWFARRSGARWATCPMTQLGLVRLLSNPAFSRDALTPAGALDLLAANVAHPRHEFWPAKLPVSAALKDLATRLTGHRQVTDAYLLALAHARRGVLATFDRGVRAIATGSLEAALEVVGIG